MALFSLLGVTFGGDGVQHFNLPKLPPNGSANYIIATAGVFPSRP